MSQCTDMKIACLNDILNLFFFISSLFARAGSRATWSRNALMARPKLSISAATSAGATRLTRVRAALHSLQS